MVLGALSALAEAMTAAPFAWGPKMIRLCDACKAQIKKGPDDPMA